MQSSVSGAVGAVDTQDPDRGNKAAATGIEAGDAVRRVTRAFRVRVGDERRARVGCIGGHTGNPVSARVLTAPRRTSSGAARC